MKFTGFLLVSILAFCFNVSAATRSWSGNGGNNNFSNPANWLENAVPVSGDSLVFPANPTQFLVNNDLTPHSSVWDTSYVSATIQGGNYQFQGNRFNIQNLSVLSGNHTNVNPQALVFTLRNLNISAGATLTYFNDRGLEIDGAGTNFITINRGSGPDAIVKRGSGKTTLYRGGINYQAAITIEGGTLEIANFDTSSINATNTNVISGVFEGQVGTSFFNAQSSSAIVKPTHIFAISVTLSNGARFIPTIKCVADFLGSVRFSQSATITGSILQPVLADGCTPKVGETSTLFINTPHNNTVTGTFNGLPEGSRIVVSGVPFRITYNGENKATMLIRVPKTNFDYDGDGKADASVFRQSDSKWYLNQSTSGFAQTQFGLSSDKLVPADYDGDGKTDVAVYRDGVWYQQLSSGTLNIFNFGLAGDVPVPADYDGDNKSDLAVYRGGVWYIQQSSDGFKAVQFGLNTDKPVTGDFDGDNKADLSVYRGGEWFLQQSANGYAQFQFGLEADKPVVADYDGDGKTDAAVFRDGIWYLLRSTAGFTSVQFGISGDKPVPADFDGDGKADLGIFRGGEWFLLQSTNNWSQFYFGLGGDVPIPNVFIP